MRKNQSSGCVLVAGIFLASALTSGFIGAGIGATRGEKAAETAREDVTEVRQWAEMLKSENDGLRQRLNEAEGEIDALEEDIDAMTEEASGTPMQGPGFTRVVYTPKSKKPLRALSKKRVITKGQFRYIVRDGTRKFGIPSGRRDMLYRWGYDIVWDGKKWESSGGTRARSNPPYVGLMQFSPSWRATKRMKKLAKKERHYHHRGDWRNCGVCSTRRWMISVRDSGYSWSATRGRWPTLERR